MFYPPLLSRFRLFNIIWDLKFGIRLDDFGIRSETSMVSLDSGSLTFHLHNVCLLYFANSATTGGAFTRNSHIPVMSNDIVFEDVGRGVFRDFIVPCSESNVFFLYRSGLAHIGSTVLENRQLRYFGTLRRELGDWLQ